MSTLTDVSTPERIPGEPLWIAPTMQITAGRDPLGMQTITIDRIMPTLVPGILALSRRARYFSFYPFLLYEYWQRRLPPNMQSLSAFIKRREYEYALAVQLCPRGCGSEPTGAVGKERAGPAARELRETYTRDESVESHLGGYGLYYRTPLLDLRIVAREGTARTDSEQPIPIDVLTNENANNLARAFQATIADTTYYRDYMFNDRPIPIDVLEELAEHACLCRLDDAPEEQSLIHAAIIGGLNDQDVPGARQRRRSFGLFLSLVPNAPDIVDHDDSFRAAIWVRFENLSQKDGTYANAVSQWAALVAKEYLQEGISSIWAHICRTGLTTQPVGGFSPEQLAELLHSNLVSQRELSLPAGVLNVSGDMPLSDFSEQLLEATSTFTLEELRGWSVEQNSAIAGLALILVLYDRLPDPESAPEGWRRFGVQRSDHQPGLLGFGRQLSTYMLESPTVSDTLAWIARYFVIVPHESLAYSKLPNFTFRFRWEQGLLNFYDIGVGRFGLTDIRRDAMSRITEDLGMWEGGPDWAGLTLVGDEFVEETFS